MKKFTVAGILAAVMVGAGFAGPGIATGSDGETSLRGNALGFYQAREAAREKLGERYGERWKEATDRRTNHILRLSQSRVRVYYSFTFIKNNNVNHKRGFVLVWKRSGGNQVGICPGYKCS